jgi:Protein of unknown function (DUF3309)
MFRALQECPDCPLMVLPVTLSSIEAVKTYEEELMGTILIVVLVLLLLGALPTWPYSGSWGYYPSGGLGLILLIVVILALTGRV